MGSHVQQSHSSVLLQESVAALVGNRSGFYVDGTFGRGGHSRLILSHLEAAGSLLAVDKDNEAIAVAHNEFADDRRFEILQSSFADLYQHLENRHQLGKVDGLLLDLGVSSPQLDQPNRGFSFLQDGPLDMRMNTNQGETAADWINRVAESEMAQVFKDFGEERYAKRIARAIVKARVDKEIATTKRLADVVSEAHPAWEKNKHPATKVFQAIRIFINNELKDLDDLLGSVLDMLTPGGRLVVISFHSLEDHRVKHFMRKQARGDNFPAGVPVTEDKLNKRLTIIGKAIKPSQQEVEHNPRARSAVMRVAEKIK